jgi:hypothetical protein
MTRRAALAGISFSTVAAAIPAAALSATSATAPDDPLADLGHRWQAAAAAEADARAQADAIEATLPEWMMLDGVPRPEDRRLSTYFFGVKQNNDRLLTIAAIRDFNCETEAIVAGWQYMDEDDAEREKLRQHWLRRRRDGRKRVAYYKAREAERAATWEASGFNARHDEYVRCMEVTNGLERAILDTPASTLVGVAVKLRVMYHVAKRVHVAGGGPIATDDDWDWQYKFGVSALRDAERLMAQA